MWQPTPTLCILIDKCRVCVCVTLGDGINRFALNVTTGEKGLGESSPRKEGITTDGRLGAYPPPPPLFSLTQVVMCVSVFLCVYDGNDGDDASLLGWSALPFNRSGCYRDNR